MSVDERETQGRGLFEADAGNVPALSVDRDAVIRGGRQRRGRVPQLGAPDLRWDGR